MKRFLGYIVDKGIKAMPRKKKVSPDIKSIGPSKTVREKGVKASVKKAKGDEFVKRIRLKDAAEKKLKTGKQMMKEGQKERKKLIDTGRAFEFRHGKSLSAIEPGEGSKFKDEFGKKPKPDKKFKTGKELEREKRMGGGMMGRRMGYSRGNPKPKTSVEKIKETFAVKGLKKIDPKKQKGLAKLKKARPDVVRKMGYFKRGGRS
jgi:hypothetical protein|tara:strand:- start:65 stop:676 length:612 start_codon:yes stop_codon:yes gene_type:complete